MKRTNLLAVAGLTLLLLAGCKGNSNEAAKDPVTATKDIAAALRANDFDRLSHIVVPPDLYTKLEARFKEEAAKRAKPTDEERKQFADGVAKFTAPDAEEKLFAEIQPKLAEVGPQIPMMVGMFGGIAGQGIQQSTTMSPAEKTQATAILTAITKWATTAPLSDPAKAKEAIKVVVKTARDLKLTTLDDAQSLSFQQTMQKSGIFFGGVRSVLAVYGFDTDKMLASVDAKKKSESGDTAVVTVTYTLLDTPVTSDVDMVKRDGRWYSADAIKNVENMLAKPVAAAPVEPAPAMSSEPPAGDMQNGSGESPASNASTAPEGDNAVQANGDAATDNKDQQPTH
jgi:hypothetical protein